MPRNALRSIKSHCRVADEYARWFLFAFHTLAPLKTVLKVSGQRGPGQQALAAGSAKPASLQTWAISSEEDSGGTLSPMDGGDDRDDHAVASADDAASLQPVRINLVPAASVALSQTRMSRESSELSRYIPTKPASYMRAHHTYMEFVALYRPSS